MRTYWRQRPQCGARRTNAEGLVGLPWQEEIQDLGGKDAA